MASAAMAGTAQASTAVSNRSGLGFDGTFSTLTPWATGGGGVQCANTGTPSKTPRLRGNFNFAANVAGMANSGEFTLPTDPDPSTYPLEACDLLTGSQPMGLGTDGYYGLMVYVPQGWTIPTKFFTGIEIQEYHFQNVYGAPIAFQLHADHVTLALQTGACNNHTTVSPGCAYHSNADDPSGSPGNLPGYYVIPPGALQQGAWNDMLMHVAWASDGTGQIQTWYKVNGAGAWTQSSNVTNIPTVQWDNTTGCCAPSYVDETEAYTGALTAPVSLWLGNDVAGSTFTSVANAMTLAPAPTVAPAPPIATQPTAVATRLSPPKPKAAPAHRRTRIRSTRRMVRTSRGRCVSVAHGRRRYPDKATKLRYVTIRTATGKPRAIVVCV